MRDSDILNQSPVVVVVVACIDSVGCFSRFVVLLSVVLEHLSIAFIRKNCCEPMDVYAVFP